MPDMVMGEEQRTKTYTSRFDPTAGIARITWVEDFYLSGVDSLLEVKEGEPEWTVEMTDGADRYTEGEDWNWYHNDPYTIGIDFWNIPYSDDTVEFTVTCNWDGQSVTNWLTLYIEEGDAPTENTIPDEIVLQVGQPTVVELGFNIPDYQVGDDAYVWFGPDDNNIDWGSDGFTLTLGPRDDAAGCQGAHVFMRTGNVACEKEILLIVKDSDGNTPGLLEFTDPNAYQNTFARAAFVDTENVEHDAWVRNYEIDHFDHLFNKYDGCEPEWSAEIIGDDHGVRICEQNGYWWADGRHNRGFDIYVENEPDYECTVEYVVTCSWGGETIYAYGTLDYTVPESLPTGLNMESEYHGLRVGEEFTYDVSAAGGFTFGENVSVGIEADFAHDHHWDWIDGIPTQTFTPHESGIFVGVSTLVLENMRIRQSALFYVADENGVEPEALLEFTDENAYVCQIARAAFTDTENVWHDGWVRNFSIKNYDALTQLWGGAPEWTAEFIGNSYGAELHYSVWDDGWNPEGFAIWLENEPTVKRTIKVRVTCTWNEETIESLCTLKYTVPDWLPTEGLIMEDEYHGLQVGQEFGYPVSMAQDFSFGDPDHFRIGVWADFAHSHHPNYNEDEGCWYQYFTPHTSGTFWGNSTFIFENIAVGHHALFFVEDGEGNEVSAAPDLGEAEAWITIPYATIQDHGEYVNNLLISDQIWSGSIGNYDTLCDLYGCEPEWSVEWDENCNAILDFRAEDEGRWAWIRVYQQPSEPTEATVVVRVNWGGRTTEKTVHLNFENANVPDDLALTTPSQLIMAPGDTVVLNVGYTPSNWGYGGFRGLGIGMGDYGGAVNPDECLLFGEPDNENRQVSITAVNPGVYDVWIDYGIGGGNSVGAIITNWGGMKVIVSEGANVFRLSTTEAMTGDRVSAFVYAPGAERIEIVKVYADDAYPTQHYYHEGDNCIETEVGDWFPYVSTLTAEAYYADTDTWQPVGNPITLTVTSYGLLEAPAFWVPPKTYYGEDVPFSFGEIGNPEDTWIKLCISDTHVSGYVVNCDYEPWEAGNHSITPDMYLDDRELEAGHIYWVGIGSWRGHYTPNGYGDVLMAVVDHDKELHLPEMLTTIEEEAFEGTSAQAVYIPSTVTSVGSHAFAYSDIIFVMAPNGLNLGNAFEGCHENMITLWYEPEQ